MALIAVAADKGSPGVTTSALALAAVWPRPVLLAECDPAGGDLVFRLPAAGGGRLDSRRGVLSLAVAARRGLTSSQIWEHVQKVQGGLDVLAGVATAEQGNGLEALWGTVGAVLAGLPEADVIADCGRLGVDGPFYDLLGQAAVTVLVSGASLGEVIRLRERAGAVATGLHARGRPGVKAQAVIIASPRYLSAALGEVTHALGKNSPASVLGGLAHEPRSAEALRGEWGGKLDKSLLIRTAREIAGSLASDLSGLAGPPRPAIDTGPAVRAVEAPAARPARPAIAGPAPAGLASGLRARIAGALDSGARHSAEAVPPPTTASPPPALSGPSAAPARPAPGPARPAPVPPRPAPSRPAASVGRLDDLLDGRTRGGAAPGPVVYDGSGYPRSAARPDAAPAGTGQPRGGYSDHAYSDGTPRPGPAAIPARPEYPAGRPQVDPTAYTDGPSRDNGDPGAAVIPEGDAISGTRVADAAAQPSAPRRGRHADPGGEPQARGSWPDPAGRR